MKAASLVIDGEGLLVLNYLPSLVALALLHGAQDDPVRDADHSRARHEAHGVGSETGRIAVIKVIAVDELARLVEEPVGDVMAGEGASVGTHAKVADTLAPAADVGAANRGKSG